MSDEPVNDDVHPDPERFWRRLRQIMTVGLAVILSVTVVAVYAYLVLDRDGAVHLVETCLWVGLFMVVLYGARDAVQSFLERWGPRR